MRDVSEECGMEAVSSEDEELAPYARPKKSAKGMSKSLYKEGTSCGVVPTFAQQYNLGDANDVVYDMVYP